MRAWSYQLSDSHSRRFLKVSSSASYSGIVGSKADDIAGASASKVRSQIAETDPKRNATWKKTAWTPCGSKPPGTALCSDGRAFSDGVDQGAAGPSRSEDGVQTGSSSGFAPQLAFPKPDS